MKSTLFEVAAGSSVTRQSRNSIGWAERLPSGRRRVLSALSCYSCVALLGWSLATVQQTHAQIEDFAGFESGIDVTGIRDKTETTPRDNTVLINAPGELSLKFPEYVRLVKLTLRNERNSWVDIDFRYDPSPREVFAWQLPQLDDAVYYTADWAILAANEQLIRGSFSFSFGNGAEAPADVMRAKALEEQERAERLFPPEPEFPLEIILDDKEEDYDPPFTIQLDD